MSESSNSNRVSVLPESGFVANQLGVAADLAQPGQGGEHVNLALVKPFLGHGFHDLLAAAAQFGQVKLALFLAQLAIAPLFDPFGQIFGDMFFEAPQQQRPQFGGKPPASDALGDSAFSPRGS